MRVIQSFLLFGLSCFPACAQAPVACRAQLQHYSVPEEYGSTYLLLFSENGTEVYADTQLSGMNSISYNLSVHGTNVLIVYQSEASRQTMIQQLRDKYASRFRAAPVDNLKYAFISLKPSPQIPYKPFDEKWYVASLSYRQPSACVFDPNKEGIAIAQTGDQDAWLPVGDQPVWEKAVQAILAWVRATELQASEREKEQCRAALRHYAVPEYGKAFSGVLASGSAKLPTRLLFADGGIQVYANTFPDGRDLFWRQVSNTGMKVLIVYQDEKVRQAMINQFRDKHALPSLGFGALVDNFKYTEIWFLPDSAGAEKGFPEKWHIGQVRHLQPTNAQTCSRMMFTRVCKTPTIIQWMLSRIRTRSKMSTGASKRPRFGRRLLKRCLHG